MLLTLALWGLVFFATFANMRPAAAQRLVGTRNWKKMIALLDRLDAYIKANVKYTPRLRFDKSTPKGVQQMVHQAETLRKQRQARYGAEL